MKIKCFSKRKLNVRISKTEMKCVILEFSQNCCIWENPEKIWSNLAKVQQNSGKKKSGKFWQKLQQFVKNQQKVQQFLTKKLRLENENGAEVLCGMLRAA